MKKAITCLVICACAACAQGGVISGIYVWNSRSFPYYDVDGWAFHPPDGWAAQLQLEDDLHLPVFLTIGVGMEFVTNVGAWKYGGGTFIISDIDGPKRRYAFEDGLCDELPGVLASRARLSFNSGSPPDDPYFGYVPNGGASNWYTGDAVYVFSETVIRAPEPGFMAILLCGCVALARRRLTRSR